MLIRAAFAAVLCSTVSAWALSTPEPGKLDLHVRTQAYDPLDRTMLIMSVNRSMNIMFSQNEMIKRVLFSRDDGPVTSLKKDDKENVPLINNLPLFGKEAGKVDLIVITKFADDREQIYQFFIDVRPAPKDGGDDPDAIYGLRFTYQAQEKVAAQVVASQTWKEKRDAEVKRVAEGRLNTDVFYGVQNWKYAALGRFKDIAPVEAHDNGRITALRYPGNTQHPSLFIVNDSHQGMPSACLLKQPAQDELDGAEQTPQISIVDDMITLQQTAKHLRLRKGDEVVDVWNCAFDPVGYNPGTGTGDPTVVRRVVSK